MKSSHPWSPGEHAITIHHQRERMAIIHIPPIWNVTGTFVFAFHGAGTDARAMRDFCGLNNLSDRKGFAVVYPNGSGRTSEARTWNGGAECGFAGKQNIDDVGFVERLVETLRDRCSATTGTSARFFATGMSNGGLMCYRLAEERGDIFSAIAPVAAAMFRSTCHPTRPVSVLHIHGLADEFVPFEGGIGKRSLTRTPFLSVPATVATWVAANGCHAQPSVERLPMIANDGTWVEKSAYTGGRANSRVTLYSIAGGGHTWPGQPSPWDFLGATTANLDANRVIWQFFAETADRV